MVVDCHPVVYVINVNQINFQISKLIFIFFFQTGKKSHLNYIAKGVRPLEKKNKNWFSRQIIA